jgi:hypothetical protein
MSLTSALRLATLAAKEDTTATKDLSVEKQKLAEDANVVAAAVAKEADAHKANAEAAKTDTAAMKQNAVAAKELADAFGNLASKFGEVSGAMDKTQIGLQGVDWTVRHATVATTALTGEQTALVDSLAKVSDQYGQTSLWVGHLISQFEAGSISIDDFRKQLAQMLIGMNTLPGAFGHTAVEMNALLSLIDKFKNTASSGWPVTTTTAPYSNPGNPLTGKP